MGLATYTYNRSSSGGEVITHLINSTDGQGLDFANGALLQLEYEAGGVFGTSDFSIEFIIDQSSANTNNKILYTSGGSNEFQITSETASSKIELTFDGADYDFSYDMSADYGSPVHYVMTFDRDDVATLYKDGNSVATVDISGSSAVDLDSSGTAAGYLGGVSDYGVTGVFYRWRTWKKLLSAAEVTACYENASVPITDQWSNCVTDLDFAFANPEMSLQIQSRSGAGDATASVGISQVTPIEAVNTNKIAVGGTVPRVGIGLPVADTPGGLLSIDATNSNTPKILFENQAGETADAAITTIDDTGGTDICIGSNCYINSSGYMTRFNAAEESSFVYASKTGKIYLGTGNTATTATTRLTIDSAGLCSFSNGIAFSSQTDTSATGAAATGTTLDHYEEGSWTPALVGTTSDPTGVISAAVGRYTKIGNYVFAEFYFGMAASGISGGVGNAEITGWPFDFHVTGTQGNGGVIPYSANWGVSGDGAPTAMYAFQGTDRAMLRSPVASYPSGAGWASADASDVGNSTLLAGFMSYHI